ncbi:MAG: hypothetical protein JWO84_698 [Parcubacteria group bacterium]|nr:hypothetical protein [Parcubacteria group bacterium]
MPAIQRNPVARPRPVQFLPGYENCSITLGSVSHEVCVRYSSAVRNASMCKGCPSPARQCAPCFKQGVMQDVHGPVDAKTGLCDLHRTQGVDAVRMPSFSVRDQGRVVKGERVGGAVQSPQDAEPESRDEPDTPEEPVSDPTPAELLALIPAGLIVKAARSYKQLTIREKQIIELIASGVTRAALLAEQLGVSPNYASVILVNLAQQFSIPKVFPSRVAQAELRNVFLTLLYAEMSKS